MLTALAACRRDPPMRRRLARLAPAIRAVRPSRWRPVSERDLAQAGTLSQAGLVAAKVAGAAFGAGAGILLGAAASFGPLSIPLIPPTLGLYLGFVGPSIAVERVARARRADADGRVGILVERLESLVAAGRPAETALAAVAARPTGAALLDASLRRVTASYALGAPLFRALHAEARSQGLDSLAALAADLERSRDLGRGSLAVIREARDALRAGERARSLEAAAQVEGKLMLILVLCYLPALLLLVVIPLFVRLLDGLFG